MSNKNQYKKRDHLALCDSCGFQFFASELRARWDGLYVCKKDWEPRHELDFIRGREENTTVPWTRPDDSADAVTIYTTNQSLSATLSGTLLFYFNTTSGAITVTLPTANNATFKNIEVVYSVVNSSGSNNLTITSASPIVGSTTVIPTTTGKYRNVPSTNRWIRES